MQKNAQNAAARKGFTLIELLIVIGIIGFLAAAVLVAVDPVKRIQEARDARRYSEVNGILNAILNKQVDDRVIFNGTTLLIDADDASSQIITRTASLGSSVCTGGPSLNTPTCPDDGALVLGTTGTACFANLVGLEGTYIAQVPVDPIGPGNDAETGIVDLLLGDTNTGYYINRLATSNRITIGACHGEINDAISVQR